MKIAIPKNLLQKIVIIFLIRFSQTKKIHLLFSTRYKMKKISASDVVFLFKVLRAYKVSNFLFVKIFWSVRQHIKN